MSNFLISVEHFFDKNLYKICLRRIFSKACSSNASKMHKIGYMRPPRGSPDASRTAQDGFCLRFWSQLGAILAILFRPRRPQRPSRRPKRPLRRLRTSPTWPRSKTYGFCMIFTIRPQSAAVAPEGPWRAPRDPQNGPILPQEGPRLPQDGP